VYPNNEQHPTVYPNNEQVFTMATDSKAMNESSLSVDGQELEQNNSK
jgi:hypothetical protein